MENLQKILKDITPEQQLALISELAKRGSQPNEIPLKKNYVNRTACELSFLAGMNPDTRYGVPLSKAYGDYYHISKAIGDFTGANAYLANLTTWNRNDLITGQRAKEFWDLIYDHSSAFMKKTTFKVGDELTYPLDIWASIEENLISSLRVGSQPTAAQLKDQVGKIGKELFAQHVEMQFNLPELDIINNYYNPNFENELVARIMIGFSNDLLRLWTNGTSDDYSGVAWATYTRSDMYKLGIGWLKNLQDGWGHWTNSNQNAVVIGQLGDRVTANKITIAALGWVNKYTADWASVVDGWIGVTSAISIASGLKILNAGYARKDGIKVPANTNCRFVFTETPNHNDSSVYGAVLGGDGTILGTSATHTGDTNATVHTIEFFSGNNEYAQLRIYQGAAQFTTVTDAAIVESYLASRSGDDIIDIMNVMLKNQPKDYKDKSKFGFVMSMDDVEKYADAKGEAVKFINGIGYGVNTTIKDQWRVDGTIPRHKGYEVTFHPYMDDVDTAGSYGGVTLYGSILFCNIRDLWTYGVGKIKKTREYKARMTSGGSGIEITNHLYTDAQTAPNERFGIAFQGATCEIIDLMPNDNIKSTPWADAEALTKAVDYVYPYCNTKDVTLIVAASKTNLATASALLATYTTATATGTLVALASLADGKTAIVPKGDGILIDEFSATKTYYAFRAFKLIDGVEVLDKSTIVSVNCD